MEIELTRAQLRVWALERLGWSNIHPVTLGNLMGLQRSVDSHHSFCPDPTREIGEAWKLWEWATAIETQESLRWPTNTPPMTVLMLEFQRCDKLWAMSAQEFAEWLVRTVYFAVEGRRVKMVDEHG